MDLEGFASIYVIYVKTLEVVCHFSHSMICINHIHKYNYNNDIHECLSLIQRRMRADAEHGRSRVLIDCVWV